jgi:hypothetical protein
VPGGGALEQSRQKQLDLYNDPEVGGEQFFLDQIAQIEAQLTGVRLEEETVLLDFISENAGQTNEILGAVRDATRARSMRQPPSGSLPPTGWRPPRTVST